MLAATLAASAYPAASEADEAGPPTLAELLRPPRTTDAALSPDGKKVALLRRQGEGKDAYGFISLLDTGDLKAPSSTVRIGKCQTHYVLWANNDRLLVSVTRPEDGYAFRRLMAIGADGLNPAAMFSNQRSMYHQNLNLSLVVDLLPDDPDHILMAAWDHDVIALHRVNVVDGVSESVERGSLSTVTWFVDRGRAVLRWDSNRRGTVWTLYGRAPGEEDWRKVRKVRRNEFDKLDIELLAMSQTPGVILAAARLEGDDAKVVRPFDLSTMTLGAPLAGRTNRDVEGCLTDEHGRLVAVSYQEDRLDYDFQDAGFAPHFRGMNKFFGQEDNIRIMEMRAQGKRLLCHVSGPRNPGMYYLYDRDRASFDPLAAARPWLPQTRLAPMKALNLKARDGAPLTAYLTKPHQEGRRPLVVLPHGGPELRDSLEFDLWVQALAAQGWAVLQVNFRGSGGYGKAFADAGRRRWGDLPQEDIEDAVALVQQDPDIDATRVAIMGGSYGGYAALMGGARRPDLYRAVVSIAGDSDLIELIAFAKSEEGGDSPVYEYWLKTAGDPATDRARMEAASPARLASRFQAPVLLIHGQDDEIVAPKQSRIMAAALRGAGKRVELIELPGMGHRGWSEQQSEKVLTPALAFLHRAFDSAA